MSRHKTGGRSPAEDRGPSSRRTTIVGGRPPEPDSPLPPVPTGIQQLLRLVSIDALLLEKLVEQRAAVADAARIPLGAHERAMLASVTEAQLRLMAAALPSPPPDRRGFLQQAAASAFALLGGGLAAACDRGSRSDVPPVPSDAAARPERNEMQTTAGVSPRLDGDGTPLSDFDQPPPESKPPPRPSHSQVTKGHIAR